MVDADTAESDALARLEAALDRIALAPRPVPSAPSAGTMQADAPDTAKIAERLDILIAQLRDGLAGEG